MITVFVPGLSGLYMYGGISKPGMGTYYPRVRRDHGETPAARAPHPLIGQGRVGGGASANAIGARKTLG